MEILRILQKSSQSADGTKLKLCQEPFANSAGERTQIKAHRLYALSSLVRSLGKPYTRYHWKQWNLYKLQREEGRDLTQSCYKRLYTNVLKIYQKPSSNLKILKDTCICYEPSSCQFFFCTLKLKENLYLELEVQIILPSTIMWQYYDLALSIQGTRPNFMLISC